MIRLTESALICRDRDEVVRVFLDYENWHRLFPATIAGVIAVEVSREKLVLDVRHKTAGRVRNVIAVRSPEEIILEEWKPRYDARFTCRFLPLAITPSSF